MEQARSIGFEENWEDRRLTSLDEWSLEQREAIPDEGSLADSSAWAESESVQSAPWQPPEGWDDTAAGDIDEIQILNFGSLEHVTLGICPEDLHDLSFLDEDEYTENSVVEAVVRVVEPMGSDKFLTLTSPTDQSTEFSARVSPESTAEPGDPISLSANLSKIHLFDDETGQNITY